MPRLLPVGLGNLGKVLEVLHPAHNPITNLDVAEVRRSLHQLVDDLLFKLLVFHVASLPEQRVNRAEPFRGGAFLEL